MLKQPSNMVSCFAGGCNHTNESHHCKFYRFPSEDTHKSSYEKWTALSRKHSYHGMSVSNKQMKMPKVSTVARMASGGHSSSSSIPHNSILVHGVPVQNLSQMQGTHNLQRAHQMAQVHHQPQAQVQAQVQAQATAQHQFLTAGRPSAPQSKYADLLVVIEDMGRDIRPTYAGSRMATERLKRDGEGVWHEEGSSSNGSHPPWSPTRDRSHFITQRETDVTPSTAS
ncbi:putative cyclin-dependent kinase 2-associated protein 1 isoform X3 [Apostichopus japonicus]|uniref:Putative cyclin-dependent kinase 2-associated protein 1 isoform X3 n=1 Tax=Stichopus japonicus TaxID=307972 RepID=A0A2G8K8V6_STIJA|nr:putative cyclin-dependent kinase 2-associated protein 1 isoform X3 [Apostichopus japonicus]